DPPEMNNLTFRIDDDTPLPLQVSDLMSLALDEGDLGNARAVRVSDPVNGALDFHDDGSFTYAPDPALHFFWDQFTWLVDAGGGLESNVVSVTIERRPTAVLRTDSYVAVEAHRVSTGLGDRLKPTSLTVPASRGLLANDYI